MAEIKFKMALDQQMYVFIDANVLLNFYRRSKSDLEELRNIVGLSNKGHIRLLISAYVMDEFYRSREKEIARSIKDFAANQTKWVIPPMFAGYPEHTQIVKLNKELAKISKTILAAVSSDTKKSALTADKIVDDLFNLSKDHIVSEEILRLAESRSFHGKPPGKRESCGDAVHWEWLLSITPAGKDLHLITLDGHFASELHRDLLSSYLAEEWRKKKRSKCTLYVGLSPFLKKHFPQIKIAKDIDIYFPREAYGLFNDALESALGQAMNPAAERIRELYTNLAKHLSSQEFTKMFPLMSQFDIQTKIATAPSEKDQNKNKGE